jgi:hypothetical protein
MYSSTCFWRPHAHHQELSNCSSSLWFYCWSVVVAVLLVVVGPVITGSSGCNIGLGWASRLLWCLLIFLWMTSLTTGMLKYVCRVWVCTDQSDIIQSILFLPIIFMHAEVNRHRYRQSNIQTLGSCEFWGFNWAVAEYSIILSNDTASLRSCSYCDKHTTLFRDVVKRMQSDAMSYGRRKLSSP